MEAYSVLTEVAVAGARGSDVGKMTASPALALTFNSLESGKRSMTSPRSDGAKG